MKKHLILPITLVFALSSFVQAAEVSNAGTYNAGVQVSFGNIDHDSFNRDQDGAVHTMFYVDYYFKDGWAIETAINSGSNVQDWICENVEDTDNYCTSSDEGSSNSFESDIEFTNVILALRYDRKLTQNIFAYGKLGAQYFDYEMKAENSVFEEDDGAGIFSELGFQYQWSNNINVNIGYQFIGMNDLSTQALTVVLGYRF